MNDSAEYLVLANVPHEPDAARQMQGRIASGEVIVHPSYEKEILTKLDDAVAGRLVAIDQANDANMALDFNETDASRAIKSLSISELEDLLQEFFIRKCNSLVHLSIGNFSQKSIARPENTEFEIALSFKVTSKAPWNG